MALREHFETSGARLFRWRSYLPLFLLAVLIFWIREYYVPFQSQRAQTLWIAACFAVGLGGLVVRSFTVGRAAPGTSGRVTRKQEADHLNTTGMYSVVRHPLYVGNYLMWIATVLLAASGWIVLIVTLAFWLYYERIMAAEEAFLRGKYGQQFERWADETPAFIPSFKRWQPSPYRFEWRRVLRQERSGLLGLVVVFAAFDVYVTHLRHGRWALAFHWQLALALALALYLVMHIDKRRSRRRMAVANHSPQEDETSSGQAATGLSK